MFWYKCLKSLVSALLVLCTLCTHCMDSPLPVHASPPPAFCMHGVCTCVHTFVQLWGARKARFVHAKCTHCVHTLCTRCMDSPLLTRCSFRSETFTIVFLMFFYVGMVLGRAWEAGERGGRGAMVKPRCLHPPHTGVYQCRPHPPHRPGGKQGTLLRRAWHLGAYTHGPTRGTTHASALKHFKGPAAGGLSE